MKKQGKVDTNVASWYPSSEELVNTQREQVLQSRKEAAAFASQDFRKPATSWWRRLLGFGA